MILADDLAQKKKKKSSAHKLIKNTKKNCRVQFRAERYKRVYRHNYEKCDIPPKPLNKTGSQQTPHDASQSQKLEKELNKNTKKKNVKKVNPLHDVNIYVTYYAPTIENTQEKIKQKLTRILQAIPPGT